MLDARARVIWRTARLGGRPSPAPSSAQSTASGPGRADRPEPPSALYAERARYHAALGSAELGRSRPSAAPPPDAPSTCHDLTLLGTTLLAGGDRPAAEDALRQALRLDVTSFWAWFILGHCHYAQGRFLEAAGDFAACRSRGPAFAWVHFNRGWRWPRPAACSMPRYAYDRALELDPEFAEALVNRRWSSSS